MTLLGSVDIPFTKSTKIAVDATDTAGQAATVAHQASDTAGQAQVTAQTASQTATQAAATAAGAAQAAQTAITTANGKNKAYYGATTPTNPRSGDIWFVEDSSGDVTAIKHYDGTQWVTDVDNTALAQQISAAQAAADHAATVGQTAQQTAADAEAKGDAATKAAEEAKDAATKAQADAASAVTSANNAVDTANTAKQVASDAATQSSNAWTKAQDAMAEAQKKADATSVYTKTDIDNALKGYATTTTVNTLTGRVDSAETAIQQNTNAIQLKADKSTVDTLTGRVSTAEATLTAQADQIAARITKTDADAKYATQTALTATANSLTSSISAVQTNLDNLQIGGRNFLLGTSTPKTVKGKGGTNERTNIYNLSTDFSNLVGKQLTISFDLIADTTSGTVTVQWNNTPWGMGGSFGSPSTTLKHYTRTLTVSDSGTATGIEIRLDNLTGNVTVSNFKLEIGNKATDWTPAPEDMATQSQITQLANDINLRVKQNDVINQINISTEGILIDGKKVHITGQTTIDNAVIKDAMIQSMTANKLTAGTIDANVITVKNINASNIVTGTLDASKATVANIDASKITTGTLNAARIAAGSIDASKLNVTSLSAISANIGDVTAGNISGVNIYGGSITQSSSGQSIWLDQNGFHMHSNQLDVWINGDHGLEILYNNETKFKADTSGNVKFSGIIDGANFSGNQMTLNNTLYIGSGKITTGNGLELDNGGLSIVSDSQYSAVVSLDGFYTYDKTNAKKLTQISFAGITTSQDIVISGAGLLADGNISASGMIKSGNVYFDGANSIKNDSTVLFLEGNGGIRTNNILINGYHAIKSLDGGEIFLNNGGTGYVDLTVKALHQSSRWELKENFESMDPEVALKNIIDTDVVRYNFKGESEVHVGLVIDDRDNPEYHACSDFITPNRESKKDDTIVGELMLATKALNNYINNHNERLSAIEEQNKNLLLKIADLESRLAKLEV